MCQKDLDQLVSAVRTLCSVWRDSDAHGYKIAGWDKKQLAIFGTRTAYEKILRDITTQYAVK